jgi:hypothetical protein
MCLSGPSIPKPPPPPVPQAPPEAPKLILAERKKATQRRKAKSAPAPSAGSLQGGGLGLAPADR